MSSTEFEQAAADAIKKLAAKIAQLEDAIIVERQMVEVLFAAAHTRIPVTEILKVAQVAVEAVPENELRDIARKDVYRKRIAQILDSNKTTGTPTFKVDPAVTIN